MGACPYLLWGGTPFWPPRSLPEHMQTEKSSLTSGVDTLSLCSSRALLLPLALSLECLGEKKAWILLHLTNTRCPAQGPTISYLTRTEQNSWRGWIPGRYYSDLGSELGTVQAGNTRFLVPTVWCRREGVKTIGRSKPWPCGLLAPWGGLYLMMSQSRVH